MESASNEDALVAARRRARPKKPGEALFEALLLFGVSTDFEKFQVKSTSVNAATWRVDTKFFVRTPEQDTFNDLPLHEGLQQYFLDPKLSRAVATAMISEFYPAEMRASLVELRSTEPALFEDLVTAKEGSVPAALQRLVREVAASYPDEAAAGADEGADEAAAGADEGGTDETPADADESGTDAPAALMVPV